MNAGPLLFPTPNGLYCPAGDFHVDPVRPVARAVITHGHSDHARRGHQSVLATRETLDIMRIRYGDDAFGSGQAVSYGESVTIGDTHVTLRPAGHVLGSAQVVIENGGTRYVVSGDYKRGRDATCEPFELMPCDIFITEATFGLPVFHHPDPQSEIRKLMASVAEFPERAHIVGAYALGKAQRVISLLREAGYERPLYLHGAIETLCAFYRTRGIDLGELRSATNDSLRRNALAGEIIIAPPGSIGDRWANRFADPVVAMASGWMQIRQRAKQSGVELPLIISDHVDWPELTSTIRDVGAEEIWVTHGSEEATVRWCGLNGIAAKPLNIIGYESETE